MFQLNKEFAAFRGRIKSRAARQVKGGAAAGGTTHSAEADNSSSSEGTHSQEQKKIITEAVRLQ